MLTVIVVVKNDEVTIRRCLESVAFADEIIVLDAGSTDNTLSISKEFTEHVFTTENWLGRGIQKQQALSEAKGDWVLSLEVDEAISESLKDEIKEVMAENSVDACNIPVRMSFYNQILNHTGNPSQPIRLFKKANARFSEDQVNEQVFLTKGSEIGTMEHPILHFRYRDLRHALFQINRDSSFAAKKRIQARRQSNLFTILFSTGWTFFKNFILQRGFLDGKAGFLIAAINAQASFYAGMKQIFRDSH